MELCINELLYDCWYKRKRKEQLWGSAFYYFMGSIIQSGENIRSPLLLSLCFPPILLIILDGLTPEP